MILRNRFYLYFWSVARKLLKFCVVLRKELKNDSLGNLFCIKK